MTDDPLDKLFVHDSQIKRTILSEILVSRIRFDTDNELIYINDEIEANKVLIYLLARYALKLAGRTTTHTARPKEISESARVEYTTTRTLLHRLKKYGLVESTRESLYSISPKKFRAVQAYLDRPPYKHSVYS